MRGGVWMSHIILSLLLCISATIGTVIYIQLEKTVKYYKLEEYPFWMFALSLFSWLYLVIASLFYTMSDTPSFKTFIVTFGLDVLLIPILVGVGYVIDKVMKQYNLTMEYSEYRNILSKYYSKDLVELVIKLISLSKDSLNKDYIKRLHADLGFYVTIDDGGDIYKTMLQVRKFLNLVFSSAKEKHKADVMEAILLEENNIANVCILINILEDKKKKEFIFSKDGNNQAMAIKEDFEQMNSTITERTSEISELVRKTSANEINYEIDKLRANRFKDINKIK